MGEVIVVTGPPGAGKSTVAEELAALLDPSALVTGDDFFGFLRSGGIPPWREDAHEQNAVVIEAAAAATGRMAGYCEVVYDGVIGPWLLETFLAATRLEYLHYAVLLPPLDACLQRVRNRQGHGFTDLDAAAHMWQDFHRAQIDPRHLLDNHQQSSTEVVRTLVQWLEEGAIRYP